MRHLRRIASVGLLVFLVGCSKGVPAATIEGPGVLRAQFVYNEELDKNSLTRNKCAKATARAGGAAIATDIAVNLAGKLVEGLIDAAAAKTQPEATTLETVIPLDGFYGAKDVAVNNGCLIFHNGTDAAADTASVKAIFRLAVSPDSTAFRFSVVEWKFSRFLKPETTRWGQSNSSRDFVLRIEFLSPGEEGLGKRAVFVEHPFISVDQPTLAGAFASGQTLPWFAAPKPPAGAQNGLNLPLNVRITMVETTRPNQFALWLQEIEKNKKTDVVDLVKQAVRKSVDPSFEAAENAKLADTAGNAYGAYKSTWDGLSSLNAGKPADISSTADIAAKTAYDAAIKAWQAGMTVAGQATEAKRVVAKMAFSAAGLPWPGDLPAVP